jgi:hypothetical protein
MKKLNTQKALLSMCFNHLDNWRMSTSLLDSRYFSTTKINDHQQILAHLAQSAESLTKEDEDFVEYLESQIKEYQAQIDWIDEALLLFK